LMYYFNFINLN